MILRCAEDLTLSCGVPHPPQQAAAQLWRTVMRGVMRRKTIAGAMSHLHVEVPHASESAEPDRTRAEQNLAALRMTSPVDFVSHCAAVAHRIRVR
jgi:hypothetical protein